ncbi:tyrosine-type recombinase/integrase [Nostoc sphaeroides]|uniref:tyrosine-type recombinase/integrase n=2 Tax=Nostoc sphaeroides TaxID=446679 RepID=UPI0012699C35|nr:tyrosine-type recombinase/integrase [Nostoc sphaeroides]
MQTKEIGNQLEDFPEESSNTRLLIACPNCGSRKLSHAGSVQRKAGKKQQYKCLECNVRFVEYFERKTKYWTDEKENVCPNCSSRNCGAHGTRKTKAGNQQQYRCRECKAKFVGKYLRPRSSKYFQPNLVEIKIYCNYCSSSNYTKKGVGRNDKQRYQCQDCNRLFTFGSQPYNYVHHNFLDISDDVWDADQLGLRVNQHQKRRKLVFLYIQQDWLKILVKKFIMFEAKSGSKQLQTLHHYISTFNSFSRFIHEDYPQINLADINRELIINYLSYSYKIGPSQKRMRLGILKLFFEIVTINQWFNFPGHLIRAEDYPKQPKRLPRYIPEDVMQQLNQHLNALPEQVMRMVLVIEETGMRIGELLQLPLNCLKQDFKGDYYIQFMRWKMLTESTIPISTELVAIIKEQQHYIFQNLNNDFEYLFCGRQGNKKKEFVPKATVMNTKSFIYFLKDLAVDYKIKDNVGKIWNFQSHQFRHTVGTRMINNGVPQHIIQRYLGHLSPAMTSVYAHIHDETLKKEITKYHETRVVNIVGETIELEPCSLLNNEELEWFKKMCWRWLYRMAGVVDLHYWENAHYHLIAA